MSLGKLTAALVPAKPDAQTLSPLIFHLQHLTRKQYALFTNQALRRTHSLANPATRQQASSRPEEVDTFFLRCAKCFCTDIAGSGPKSSYLSKSRPESGLV